MIGFFSSMPAKLTRQVRIADRRHWVPPGGGVAGCTDDGRRRAGMMRRRQRFRQHSSRGLRGRIDSEQRSQRHREIDRLGVRPVDSRLKGEAIEGERHMSIVRERRRMIGTLRDSDLKWRGDSDHIPSAFGRVAVGVAAADFRGRSFSTRQLRLGKVSGESRLLHGFARVGFGVGFVFLSGVPAKASSFSQASG